MAPFWVPINFSSCKKLREPTHPRHRYRKVSYMSSLLTFCQKLWIEALQIRLSNHGYSFPCPFTPLPAVQIELCFSFPTSRLHRLPPLGFSYWFSCPSPEKLTAFIFPISGPLFFLVSGRYSYFNFFLPFPGTWIARRRQRPSSRDSGTRREKWENCSGKRPGCQNEHHTIFMWFILCNVSIKIKKLNTASRVGWRNSCKPNRENGPRQLFRGPMSRAEEEC